MDRYFEKISFEQFSSDVSTDRDLYNKYLLPSRGSKNSCGYDFFSIQDVVIHPKEIVKIPTGYKAKFRKNEFLMLVVRSSMGFKYNVRMCNQVGIIDCDYYNNEDNEGHIWVCLQNEGDTDFIIKKNTAYLQGIFVPFLTCGDDVTLLRKGGFGSTDLERNEI